MFEGVRDQYMGEGGCADCGKFTVNVFSLMAAVVVLARICIRCTTHALFGDDCDVPPAAAVSR